MTAAREIDWQPVRPDFERDRWGRPIVTMPDGSRGSYTRTTTYVGAPDDLYNVHRWEMRQLALGLSARPDLVLDVLAHRLEPRKLNETVDRAKEVAGATAAATRGSAVHALSELIDVGQDLPPGVDTDTRLMLEAYRNAMSPFKVRDIELHLVQDQLGVAGTADRTLGYRGRFYIGDIKTGSTVELGTGKIAGQLAMYARSRPYDVNTNQRLDHHGCSVEWGLVIHLPADSPGTVTLHWIDLLKGWEWCKVARDVREQRAHKVSDWLKPFDPSASPEPSAAETRAEGKADLARMSREILRDSIIRQIKASDTRDLVTSVWRMHEDSWDAELTEIAKAHIAGLGAA